MDKPTQAIVEFTRSATYDALTQECIHSVVRNYFDSIACAAAGFYGESSVVARKVASGTGGTPLASVFGLPDKALVEFAVLANSTSTRYCDWNDVVLPSGHPSDVGPALVAVAESRGKSGQDLVRALYVAYEVYGAVGDVVPIRDLGWDQGFFCSLSTVAGLGSLMELSAEQIGHAIALAITPSIPLRVTRAGQLSHWKAAAGGHATMTATLATRMAEAGMTGPANVFEGVEGVFEKVTGPFELGKLGPAPGKLSIAERTQHKYFPAFADSQGSVHLMLQVRDEVPVTDIESIHLDTYYLAWHEGGGGQGDHAEKWDPKTRETADHSLPFLMAAALVDGPLTLDSFTPARIADPALRPLMNKITVTENKAYTELEASSGKQTAVVEVTTRDGRKIRKSTEYPRGHHDNPMTDDELGIKFDSMVAKLLPAAQHKELRDRLWNLPGERDLDAITGIYRQFGTA